ncbi:MAG: hypothetical protein RR461_09150 [Angelakisella sp.]
MDTLLKQFSKNSEKRFFSQLVFGRHKKRRETDTKYVPGVQRKHAPADIFSVFSNSIYPAKKERSNGYVKPYSKGTILPQGSTWRGTEPS